MFEYHALGCALSVSASTGFGGFGPLRASNPTFANQFIPALASSKAAAMPPWRGARRRRGSSYGAEAFGIWGLPLRSLLKALLVACSLLLNLLVHYSQLGGCRVREVRTWEYDRAKLARGLLHAVGATLLETRL